MKLLIYPTKESATAELSTADSVERPARQKKLYEFFRENGSIEPIREFDEAQLHIAPGEVLKKLQAGDPQWRDMVPSQVAELIQQRGLFTEVATTPAT